MIVRTRFAPSSTGCLHLGSMRTALYSWLFARHYNGKFVLRIEDTDTNRSNKKFINNILKTLHWLGISYDKGPYLQSQRLLLYKQKILEMLKLGCAYKCYCSVERLKEMRNQQILKGQKPRYDHTCRNLKYCQYNDDYVVRFKNPLSGQVMFDDQIRGKIVFNNSELDDVIIQRKNGMPTYNFCVVIDDLMMNITHVIRGEDHINNTPRQINILKALNVRIPIYAHVSMVVDNKKNNLSKRKDSLGILKYKKMGFLKESILNYLFKMGWSSGDQEIFGVSEMKKLFSIKKISKSSVEFNFKKLLWINHYYLNNLSIHNNLIHVFKKFLDISNIQYNNTVNIFKIIRLLRSRCYTIQDMIDQSKYFFYDVQNFNVKLINKYFFSNISKILHVIYEELFSLAEWNTKNIINVLKKISDKFNISFKNVCMSVRIAVTGLEISPSISSIMSILGKKNSILRIKKLIIYFD